MSYDVEDALGLDAVRASSSSGPALPRSSEAANVDDATARLGLLAPRLDAPRSDATGANDGDCEELISTPTFRVDEALDAIGFGKFQLGVLAFTGFAWVSDAMEMMLLSFIGPAMRCEFHVSARAEGALTSAVFAGMMLGAPGWGALSDSRGRRAALLFATTTTIIGGLGSALAPSFSAVLAFRCVVGVGLGGVPVAFGLFTEFLPSSSRGVNLTLINLFWTLGSALESALAWIVLPRYSWRVLLLVSTLPLFVLIACLLIVPESPLYSMAANRDDEAMATLSRVAATNRKLLPRGRLVPTVTTSREELEFETRIPYGERTFGQKYIPKGLRALLGAKHRKTSLLVWFIFFGVAFLYYGAVLLNTQLRVFDGEDVNGDIACLPHGAPYLSNSEYLEIFIDSLAEVPGVVLAAIFIDSLGRKRTMSYTLLITGVMLIPLAFGSMRGFVRNFLLFFTRSSAFAGFTAVYVFSAEIYPTHMRSSGIGVANGWARIGGMVCPFFSVAFVENGNLALAIAVFVSVALLSAWCATSLDVETAGRKLDAEEPGIELAPVPIS